MKWEGSTLRSDSTLKEAIDVYIYLGWIMALSLSEPLDVQLGRRGSGEQQTMNLKSQI